MHVERIKRLIQIMSELEQNDRLLRMASWVSPIYDNEQEICGTACCALGWAAFDPQFQDEGLVMMMEAPGGDTPVKTMQEMNERLKKSEFSIAYPMFNRLSDPFQSGADFFDITDEQSAWLFDSVNYEPRFRSTGKRVAPQDVINRLNFLLENPDYEVRLP